MGLQQWQIHTALEHKLWPQAAQQRMLPKAGSLQDRIDMFAARDTQLEMLMLPNFPTGEWEGGILNVKNWISQMGTAARILAF